MALINPVEDLFFCGGALELCHIYSMIAYLYGSSANSMAHKCISILQKKDFHFLPGRRVFQ